MPQSAQAETKKLHREPQAPQPAGPQSQTLPPEYQANSLIARADLDASRLSPSDVLRLQRMVGNRAVSQILAAGRPGTGPIQAKLTVGAAGDRYEQEADRVAEQVVSSQQPAASPKPQAVRRQEDEEEIQAKLLAAAITPFTPAHPAGATTGVQRSADGSFDADPGIEGRLAARRGTGAPLPPDTSAFMERRFGADFNKVRLHTDPEAGNISRKLGAQAFTHGQDIYLGAGRYQPGTGAGKRLLAHELAHTIQQAGAPRVQRNGEKPVDPREDPAFDRLPPMQKVKKRQAYEKALAAWEAAERAKAPSTETSKPAAEAEATPVTSSAPKGPAELPAPPGLTAGIGPSATAGDWVVRTSDEALIEIDTRVRTGTNDAVYLARILGTPVWTGISSNDAGFKSIKPEQKTIIQDLYNKPKGKLYPSLKAEGTFEYVSESLYQSLPPEHQQEFWQRIYRQVGKAPWIKPKEYTDPEKKQILLDMLHKAYVPYDRTYTPAELNSLAESLGRGGKLKQVDELFKVLIVQTADDAELRGLEGWSVGFHGTNKPMDVVTGAAGTKVAGVDAWGGIRQPQQVAYFQNQWGLSQTSWNPMAEYLANPKTKANFRLGINKDNDLLSTVSVGTRINPCIEFPHGKGKDTLQPNFVYAVLYEKAYPTFVKQAEYGSDLPSFPEIAVEGVEPKRIIGNVAFQRQYTAASGGSVSHADFSYWPLGGFQPNPLCQAEYPGIKYARLRQTAEDQFTKEKHMAATADNAKKWSLGVA
jgi:Domain of unknown function (DUF4157)